MTEVPSMSVIVLAAGEGTRMRSRTPKVLHAIGGRTLLGHAVSAATRAGAERIAVVVRHERDLVVEHLESLDADLVIADQDAVKGTGRAVECGLDALPGDLHGTVLVTMGDVPLLQAATLVALAQEHEAQGNAATVVTASLADPTGYGRILRDADGTVRGIVEQKDATEAERAIAEINSGIYAFDADLLREALAQVGADNVQGEKYLTDVLAIARRLGRRVGAYAVSDVWQTEGVNDRVQLSRLGAELNRRTVERWMREGVTVIDPASTWVDVTVTLGQDVTVEPGVQLRGETSVGEAAVIGPDTTLTDVSVGARASVVRTHGSESVIEESATVGPFAYLRPGTRLRAGGKIGTFVETKKADIGAGSKVPHLSYVGDATIGERTNIGAGTIFANYDGVNKHATSIGSHVKTGSHNVFVAPVSIADGAVTGAGTVVRQDVPPGALAVSAGPQRSIEGWVARKRPGSDAADVANAALRADEPVMHTEKTAGT